LIPSHREEALRSIIISQRLLGTREIAVFRHTGCGMLTFTTPQLRDIIKKAHLGDEVVAQHVDAIDFQEFPHLEERVKADVEFLQKSPLVLKDTKISGWVYSVETGKVNRLNMRNKSKYSRTDGVIQITQIA
jgi:carbonic anhydrase